MVNLRLEEAEEQKDMQELLAQVSHQEKEPVMTVCEHWQCLLHHNIQTTGISTPRLPPR